MSVRLASGEELQRDLVVGADGLRSTVRAALFEEPKPRFTGYVTWRCLVPAARVPGGFGAQITVWLGRGRHAMLYPIRDGLFNFSGFVPAEEVHRETWSPSADVDDLMRSFKGACAEVISLIESVETALITPLYFRDPLDRWGTGRITLLGDAAHPAPPSAGQGASMALEDAVTLAECLRRDGPDGLEDIRAPPDGANAAHAGRVADQPGALQRERPRPGESPQRATARPSAPGPRRRVDGRVAVRA